MIIPKEAKPGEGMTYPVVYGPINAVAYRFELWILKGWLSGRSHGPAEVRQLQMRYAAIYVIGWGCA